MSDHPTVTAAAQALLAADGFNDWAGAPQGWKRIHKRSACQAVTAAFRERAEHVISDCEDKTFGRRFPGHRGWDPCKECDTFADMLTYWADEIEASRG